MPTPTRPSHAESGSPLPLTAPTTLPESPNKSAAQFFIDTLAIIYAFDATIYRIVKTVGLTGINLETPAKKDAGSYSHPLYDLFPAFFSRNLVNPLTMLLNLRSPLTVINSLAQFVSLYPLLTFFQSFLIGFENKISVTMGERLKETQGLSKIQQEFVNVYQELQEYIEHAPEAAKTRTGLIEYARKLYQQEVQCFTDTYNGIMGRSGMIPKHAEAVLSGDDFMYSPTENRVAVGKKLRELYSRDEIGGNKKFAEMGSRGKLFFLADCVPAVFSAGCSLFFINIDWSGRYLGEMTSALFIHKFGISPKQAEKIIMAERGILALLYVINEVYWFAGTLCSSLYKTGTSNLNPIFKVCTWSFV